MYRKLKEIKNQMSIQLLISNRGSERKRKEDRERERKWESTSSFLYTIEKYPYNERNCMATKRNETKIKRNQIKRIEMRKKMSEGILQSNHVIRCSHIHFCLSFFSFIHSFTFIHIHICVSFVWAYWISRCCCYCWYFFFFSLRPRKLSLKNHAKIPYILIERHEILLIINYTQTLQKNRKIL